MAGEAALKTPPPQAGVIRSKLTVPILPEAFAPRPRLERRLAKLMKHKRAVVVTASAGSGKTTAVAGALRDVRRPVAWLTVDRSDIAPGRLVSYLEAAIARATPTATGVATAAVAAGIPHEEAAGLLAEAMGRSPIVLVLDELERLGEAPEAWRVLEALLRYMPLGSCAVLVSRRDVPTALCALPAPPAAATVSDADVAFTIDEAERALARVGNETADAKAVVASTAGWVTGVLFEGWRADTDVVAQGGETDPVYEYLASQMLADLDEPERDLLVITSLLDDVDATRAEALGVDAAGEMLDRLRAQHLPIAWDAEGKTMRAHSFFREYLLTRLERRGEETLRELRMAHGRLLAAEGHNEEAVEAFLQAGAPEEALAPAETAITGVVDRLDFAIAERWIAALAAVEKREPSPLTVAELMLAIAVDDIERGVRVADRLAASGNRELLAESSQRAAWLMSWCYLHHARYDDVEALLEVSPPGLAVDTLRYAMSALTDRPGVQMPAAPLPPGGPLNAILCIADYARGRVASLAEPSGSHWIEAIERPWRIAALRARGRTKEALEEYERAAGNETAALATLAGPDLLMDAGRWEQAADAIRRGRAIVGSSGSHAFIGLSRVLEAKLALRERRDAVAALAALDHRECVRAMQGFSFIAEQAGAWAGLALLIADRDEEARERLGAAVGSMVAGDRILELPAAAAWLSEAEARAGDEEAAERAAQTAIEAARRQGSNHLLLAALAFFPAIVARRIEAESDVDSSWHELGRALMAQGVNLGIAVHVPVRLKEFGRRAILVEGEEVKPRIAKSYELLAYVLARSGGECDRDELLDALFDGRRDDSKRAYLRQAIRWLREALPAGSLHAEGQLVRVGVDVPVASESVELERLLAEAARLQGRERLEATLQALAIYDEGPYLPGARGGWADDREHHLAELATEARYQAAVLSFGEGRYDESRGLVDAVLHEDPLREAAWRLAIRLAQTLGDIEGVARTFAACEKALADVGAKPSQSTRLLLERARR